MRNHKVINRASSNGSQRCEVTGKIKYRTRHSAERRRLYEHRYLGFEESRSVHYCKYCGAWHITHYRLKKRRMNPYDRNRQKRNKR